MQIDFLLPCHSMRNDERFGPTILGAGANVRWADLPGRAPIAIAIGVSAPAHEAGAKASVRVQIYGPGMEDLGWIANDVTVSPSVVDGWASKAIIPLEMELQADVKGTYTFSATIGDSAPATTAFVILPVKEMPAHGS